MTYFRFDCGDDEEGRAFKALVLETWKRIPLDARLKLQEAWRTKNIRPRMRLVDTCCYEGDAFGLSKLFGCEIWIVRGLLDDPPEAVLTIAHELAHAYLEAVENSGGGDEDEITVHELMADWGFE